MVSGSRTAAGIIVFLLMWQGAVMLFRIPDYILPTPWIILTDAAGKWRSLLYGAFYTAQPMVLGFILAVVAGVLIALVVAFSRTTQAIAYPLLVFLQIVPKIAVAPLFIIWFGFGFTPKLLLVFLLSFFPIVIASIAGFRAIDPEIMDFVHTTGAGGLRAFAKVRLPYALPEIFTGLKVGAAISATAAVVAEFVASDRGLGYLLLQYNGDLNTQMVFATVMVLGAIGLVVYFAVELLERLVSPWHASQTDRRGDLGLV